MKAGRARALLLPFSATLFLPSELGGRESSGGT